MPFSFRGHADTILGYEHGVTFAHANRREVWECH